MARQIENIPAAAIHKTVICGKNLENIRKNAGLTQEEFSIQNGFGGRQNYASYQRKNDFPVKSLWSVVVNHKIDFMSLFDRQIRESEISTELPEQALIRINDLNDKIKMLMLVIESKDDLINMKNAKIQELEILLNEKSQEINTLQMQLK